MGKPSFGADDLPLLDSLRKAPRIHGLGDAGRVESGTRIGAFRVERLIGTGSIGSVYEATQLSLKRTVALRLIEAAHFESAEELARFDDRQRQVASLHHPNLVAVYEAGEWEGGRFVAMRLIRGRSLLVLAQDRTPLTAASLDPVADALAAVHAAGLAHGRVSERSILVEADGTAYLADLGLVGGGSAEADARALAHVADALPEQMALARARTAPRRLRLALAAVGAIAVVALALVLTGGGDSAAGIEAPSHPAGTDPLGSALAPGGVEALGCAAEPTPNTPACTIAQATVGGAEALVQKAGVVRGWAVRGATGEVALQVIRKREGNSFVAGFSQPQNLGDAGPTAFDAEITVKPGDLIGVLLGPGAVIGARSGLSEHEIVRWDGGLTGDPARKPDSTTKGIELMLRADIEAGARPEGPRQLVGARAAGAPPGTVLAEAPAVLSGGRTGRLVVVELPTTIALDVFRRERLARIEVPDADPAGELLGLTQNCGPGGARGFCLRWSNPGMDLSLEHEYQLRGSGQIDLIG